MTPAHSTGVALGSQVALAGDGAPEKATGVHEGKKETMSTTDTGAMRPLLFADDLQFWYETLRWLGLVAYGGADFGEVVTTAARITANDYDSW